MDSYIKDLIDAISKIGGLITVVVGIVMALHQIKKGRDQKERELKEREFEIKTQRAIFWLELRKMFYKFEETHRMLRNDKWPCSNDEWAKLNKEDQEKMLKERLPELEAYMGLFEHCKFMIDDGLIDITTFKSIYAYRIENIAYNIRVVDLKFKDIKIRNGWKDFIELAEQLDIKILSS